MEDFNTKKINLILYLPPVLFTLIFMMKEGWYTWIIILPSFLIWLIILMTLWYIYSKIEAFFITKNENKEFAKKIISDMNINMKQWKMCSLDEKKEFYQYSVKYDKVIKFLVSTNNSNIAEDKKITRQEIENQWLKFSLQERKSIIDKIINEIEEIENKKLEQFQETKRFLENIRKKDEEKKLIEEQIRNKKRKDLEDKQNFIILQKIEKEKEEKKRLEEARREEQIKQREIQREIDYKEKVKRELLEKQRKIQLESEAIQELINSGQINEAFSIQNKRQPIPSHIKEAVWKRDKQSCVICGSKNNLEFDHNIPFSKGGSNSINNIQLLCQNCNRKKSNKIM